MPLSSITDSLRIAIEISGATMEQESQLATIITESLADGGFKNVFVIASEVLYADKKAVEEYNQQNTILSKEQPIVTIASPHLH